MIVHEIDKAFLEIWRECNTYISIVPVYALPELYYV